MVNFLGNGRSTYQRPRMAPAPATASFTRSWTTSIPSSVPGRKFRVRGRTRVNVGNYSTEAMACHAHHHASVLLGHSPTHTTAEGEVTPSERAAAERQVRAGQTHCGGATQVKAFLGVPGGYEGPADSRYSPCH